MVVASTREERNAWKKFKCQFKKSYANKCEEQMRRKIFLENKRKVDAINRDYAQGKSDVQAKLFEWSDLTPEEAQQQLNGYR